MRKRKNRVEFYLSDKEYSHLKILVRKSGMNSSQYLRQLIKGIVPCDLPPPDYFSMMRELYAIGNNINQIAMIANATGNIDAERYERNFEMYKIAVAKIKNAVTESSRIKRV